MLEPKLTIELVPKTCWKSNVRDCVTKEEWDKIKTFCYKRANYRCEICGGKGDKHPVECHEVWDYQETKIDDRVIYAQKLTRLLSLCPSCHQVKHIGLAELNGKLVEASNHLQDINGWTKEETEDYIGDVFWIWRERNGKKWNLDISHLKELGFKDMI